ncbi:MAG: MerR family transcriptional regulator [Planctomycetota bacterium]|jgi:excisionase family DNA binding protein
MEKKYLTTGQAADRCSVTPDTVLKWIRSGLLPARRTAGGHNRISEEDLEKFLELTAMTQDEAALARPHRQFRYCWEYYGDEKLNEGCRECAVFLMRAQRCYDVTKYAPQAFHPKVFCKKSCEECDYYREVQEQITNVLVVTDNSQLAGKLKQDATKAHFNLETADCEYTCSMVVNSFKPDFAIIDCSLGREVSRDITTHLAEDPRIPIIRVVLAGNDGEFPSECEKLVFARLKRPFGIDDINDCVDGTRATGRVTEK